MAPRTKTKAKHLKNEENPFSSLKIRDTKVVAYLPQYNIHSSEDYLKLSKEELFETWKAMRRNGTGICFGSFKYMLAAHQNINYSDVVVPAAWDKENEAIKQELREMRKRKRQEEALKEEKPNKALKVEKKDTRQTKNKKRIWIGMTIDESMADDISHENAPNVENENNAQKISSQQDAEINDQFSESNRPYNYSVSNESTEPYESNEPYKSKGQNHTDSMNDVNDGNDPSDLNQMTDVEGAENQETIYSPTDNTKRHMEYSLALTSQLFDGNKDQMLNFDIMSSFHSIFNSRYRMNSFKSGAKEKRIESRDQYVLDLYRKEYETNRFVQEEKMKDVDVSSAMVQSSRLKRKRVVPQWHAPWKLMRVISGVTGWVRALDVDYTNEWFVSGGADRLIKFWDLASGKLRLSLTGHISTIRGLKLSERYPYLFSVSEDKTVRCWDLNQNKNIKKYHGHMSSVSCIDIHPTLDIIVTGGRDKVARVWDMRTQAPIWVLEGHLSDVSSVACQGSEPQIITGSQDCTVRCWDMRTGKTRITLTNHKKSIRSIVIHPSEYTFATAAADSLKKWQCPKANFLQNFMWSSASYHHENQVINTACINQDDVYVTGSNDGYLHFWDWKTGNCFQSHRSTPQSGSLDCEASIFASVFDRSGSRLLTGEGDKTIKIWKEDETATEETHPVNFNPDREELVYF